MGRGKIEIKKIENTSNRAVTYAKRKAGIFKKAREIAILCDVKVSLIIVSGSGKMDAMCSPDNSLSTICEEYHKHSKEKLWPAKHENLYNEIEMVKKENENMVIELRHLNGQDINLNHYELIPIEEALENGLLSVRARKSELVNILRQNIEAKEEEHKRLICELHQKMEIVGDGYHHDQRVNLRDYNAHIPLAFRVQPMQPNLQDRI
ncbi:floral homeotic protein PMADS 2 [Humulus lupulus]|uniref:floral homeotic protein PMADS 2 n=1 Tax=Humulus lupulus TaxID=3486 RepID=UPI002B40BF22|nr:floral homeotic protein PMADS 2 [Humulus lupulus]